MKSGPGDGTGMDAPKGENGLDAFQDAKPAGSGSGAGAGDGGSGTKKVGSRTTPK